MAAITLGSLSVMSTMANAEGEYHYWNGYYSPLTVTGYGSTGYGYGKWRVADTTSGTGSYLDSYQKIADVYDHKVYTTLETWSNAGYCVQPDYTSCSAQWYFWASSNTPHTTYTAYHIEYTHTNVNPSGDYARAHVYMKLDIPWRTDPQAGPTITTGSSY